MKLFPFHPHEILFLLAGLGMLVGVLVFESSGTLMWVVSKSAYIAGVVLFVIHTLKHVRN
jgi:hypothetical protein